MPSNIQGETKKGKNHSLNASNFQEEINYFERTGLNGPCPNANLLPLIESKTIEGERKSTYWCMLAVLNSLFFLFHSFLLLSFLLFCFTSFPSQYLLMGYVFLQKFLLPCFRIPLLSAQQGVCGRLNFSVRNESNK